MTIPPIGENRIFNVVSWPNYEATSFSSEYSRSVMVNIEYHNPVDGGREYVMKGMILRIGSTPFCCSNYQEI